ncbi:MAG: DUF2179 domain-containing protein [Planctomycetes bacterium]|nr:DUF2179 domain-containing protein [Planctomycetota bacterium]MCL4728881.1 DUF2179 domain-containing protein [Planctomycetota bacterium]
MAISLEAWDFSWDALGGAALIALARMFDMSLAVLRMSNTAAGRKKSAWIIAFFEALIWVFVVAGVVQKINNPVYAVAYAIGFASGTFLGITAEQFFARGEQVVRVFTHHGDSLASELRTRGYRVTQMEGKGRDGPIQILFIHVPRKKAQQLPKLARELDNTCFIVIDDVRSSSAASRSGAMPPAAGK